MTITPGAKINIHDVLNPIYEQHPNDRVSMIKDSRQYYLDIGVIRSKSRNSAINSLRVKS